MLLIGQRALLARTADINFGPDPSDRRLREGDGGWG